MIQLSDKLYRCLTDDGLTTGSDDMAVDGSSTAVPFYVGPTADEKWLITRIIIAYRHSGTWTEVKYGSLSELTNGVELQVMGGTDVVVDLLAGQTIKNNSDWSAHCYDADIRSVGSGDSYMAARWSLFKDSDEGLILGGHRSERLVMTVNDNLSAMSLHHVDVRGHKL